MNSSNNRGFSLVEVLVVLIIFSMVTALVVEGGSHLLLMRDKLLRVELASAHKNLAHFWFRSSLQAAYPVPELEAVFSARQIVVMSYAPLMSASQQLQKVEWTLVRDGEDERLQYREAQGEPVFIRRWRYSRAEFIVSEIEFGEQLPGKIELFIQGARGDERVIASLPGRKAIKSDFRVLE